MNRFLVIVRAGDRSLHPHWTSALATRDWDLVVSYFGDDPARFREGGETRIDDKGLKWPGLHALLARDDFWCGYDYIWLPDDDLAVDQATISALFRHVVELDLALAQPALSWISYYAHTITVQHPTFRARWTNFVEIMAPCFERRFLEACLPTFGESLSGWGLDWIWPRQLGAETRRSGVIDAVTVTHTRPVGGPTYAKLSELGVSAEDEGHALLRKYGMERDRPKTIRAIDARGVVLDGSVAEEAKVLEELLARDRNAFAASRLRLVTPSVVLTLNR
ncbi:MAG TPA: hypothetical protein VF814_07460 [Casimicrobiaceae bacterium]